MGGAAGLWPASFGRARFYLGPRSVAASTSTSAASASVDCQSCPRTARGERRPSPALGPSHQARMPMALYPQPRPNATRATHSSRRVISGGTGRRPFAYERTEVATAPTILRVAYLLDRLAVP